MSTPEDSSELFALAAFLMHHGKGPTFASDVHHVFRTFPQFCQEFEIVYFKAARPLRNSFPIWEYTDGTEVVGVPKGWEDMVRKRCKDRTPRIPFGETVGEEQGTGDPAMTCVRCCVAWWTNPPAHECDSCFDKLHEGGAGPGFVPVDLESEEDGLGPNQEPHPAAAPAHGGSSVRSGRASSAPSAGTRLSPRLSSVSCVTCEFISRVCSNH